MGGLIMKGITENADLRAILEGLEPDEFYLPVGYVDEEGVIHRKGRLTLMDGNSEEAMSDAKIRDNGGKVITALLHSVVAELEGVPKVTKELIKNLSTIDRDYLLAKNRAYSLGEKFDFVTNCSVCGKRNEVFVDLNNIEVKYLDDDAPRTVTFELFHGYRDRDNVLHKTMTISLPTGAVQERIMPIARVNAGQANTTLLQLITDKLGTMDFINPDVFKSLSKRDRDLASEKLREIKAGIEFVIKCVCSECGQEFDCMIP